MYEIVILMMMNSWPRNEAWVAGYMRWQNVLVTNVSVVPTHDGRRQLTDRLNSWINCFCLWSSFSVKIYWMCPQSRVKMRYAFVTPSKQSVHRLLFPATVTQAPSSSSHHGCRETSSVRKGVSAETAVISGTTGDGLLLSLLTLSLPESLYVTLVFGHWCRTELKPWVTVLIRGKNVSYLMDFVLCTLVRHGVCVLKASKESWCQRLITYFPESLGRELMMINLDDFSCGPLISSLIKYIWRPKDMRDRLEIIWPFFHQEMKGEGTDSAEHSSDASSPVS